MRKKLTVYSTHTETREFRLPGRELRKLLKLPAKKGLFAEAHLNEHGDLLTLKFQCIRYGRRTIINQ